MEGDAKGAEECYGRAILASPGDGEVLSLYGKLVWETHRDVKRAEGYFERAVEASPDDWYHSSLLIYHFNRTKIKTKNKTKDTTSREENLDSLVRR